MGNCEQRYVAGIAIATTLCWLAITSASLSQDDGGAEPPGYSSSEEGPPPDEDKKPRKEKKKQGQGSEEQQQRKFERDKAEEQKQRQRERAGEEERRKFERDKAEEEKLKRQRERAGEEERRKFERDKAEEQKQRQRERAGEEERRKFERDKAEEEKLKRQRERAGEEGVEEKRSLKAERLEELKRQRKERVEEGGKRVVIEEPDSRVIVKEQDRLIIRHDESERFRRKARDVRERRRPDGIREAIFVRPDGAEIVAEYDDEDRLLRRVRREGGREYILIDNRDYYSDRDYDDRRNGRRRGPVEFYVELPPLEIGIPREQYIVEYDSASEEDLYEALTAPPLERLDRDYALEEIRQSYDLRERMRSVDLDTINFEFGSWEVAPEYNDTLERLAEVINRILEENPEEVFLIEAHSDAVGPEIDNLSLSDRRAEAVAIILTDAFGVPAENLVTQGYGEQFLKIPTELPERENRRVSVRPIKPLMSRGYSSR
jgi:outer membrane protein OmpA-like peptidoglycan-associated protein